MDKDKLSIAQTPYYNKETEVDVTKASNQIEKYTPYNNSSVSYSTQLKQDSLDAD